MTLFWTWNYPKFHMEKEAGVFDYIHCIPASGFIFGPHHCTKCTVFLCGWWHWWGSRVEMGFSCSCLGLTLAQQLVKTLMGHKRSVCLPGFQHSFQLSHVPSDMSLSGDSWVRCCTVLSYPSSCDLFIYLFYELTGTQSDWCFLL